MHERDIFFEAIEIPDPEAQDAYLKKVCGGHHALRERLRELLAMHNGAGSFLQKPVIDQIHLADSAVPPDSELTDGGPAVPAPGDVLQRTVDAGEDSRSEIALPFLQSSTRPDALGRLGHYEILQVLGQGAFGIVLRAFDDKLLRMVAIKVIASGHVSTSSIRQRFLREARAFAAIRDPNTVQIHAIEEVPVPYLVMEYVPSQTIEQRIDERGPMSVQKVLQIGQQIASGLAAAHAVGLIHRDIKPANILLEEGGTDRVKITDFGLARALDGDSPTQTEVIAGTPMFMSPEQARGEAFDQRADLFSVGSVLYYMLSGRPPFRATTTTGLLRRVAEETPPPIQEIVPAVPEWLCRIIIKLHAKDPDDRFATAKEIADLLNRCLIDFERGAVPVLEKIESQSIRRSVWLRNGRWLAAGIAAFVVTAALMNAMRKGHVPQPAETSTVKAEKIETEPEAHAALAPSIELGPLIKPGNLGDGVIADVSFRDHVLSLDATSGSRQLWVNFPDVAGEELMIETEFRAARPTNFGMGKLIFMPDRGKQTAAVVVFGPKGHAVYIESSGETFPESDKIPSPGAVAADWKVLKFVVTAETYSFTVDGKVVMEKPRDSRCSGYVAVACIGSLCEMKDLRVTRNKVSSSPADR